MTNHAFVDESIRGRVYIMGVVLLDPSCLTRTRRALRDLVPKGQRRLHFNGEKDPRRRKILSQMSLLNFEWTVYIATDGAQSDLRSRLLRQIVEDLVADNALRIVLESRHGQDEADRRILYDRLGPGTQLQYGHSEPATEPLLWLPDCLAWAWGRGGDYRKLLEKLGIGPRVVVEVE